MRVGRGRKESQERQAAQIKCASETAAIERIAAT